MLCHTWYGDKSVLERNYEGFCRWTAVLEGLAEGGVLDWGLYGDWCPALPFAKPENGGTNSGFVKPAFVSAAYLVRYIKLMREVAGILGKTDEATAWNGEAQAYTAAFMKRYYNAGTGLIGGGSQTECAVAMTVFPEDTALCAALAKHAAADIKARGFHTTCGNQGYLHLFYRLADAGYAETLVDLLKNDEYPGWGYMLRSGATTVWERWEREVGSDMHSFNHPMFSGYDGFFYNYLAGIRTEECQNAFAHIVIEPCFVSRLSHVSARLATVRGAIAVEWMREGNGITLQITTPANTSVTVRAKGYTLTLGDTRAEGKIDLSNGTFVLSLRAAN
jgi:alpha-L-rhamnosidase